VRGNGEVCGVSTAVLIGCGDTRALAQTTSNRGRLCEMGASGFLERRARELTSNPPEGASGWRLLEELGPLYTATTPAEAVRLMRGTKDAMLVEDLENDDTTWCDTRMIGKPIEGELTDVQKRGMLRRGEEEDGAKEKRCVAHRILSVPTISLGCMRFSDRMLTRPPEIPSGYVQMDV
jgi:hypothetical protein